MHSNLKPVSRQRFVFRITLLLLVLAGAYFAWRGPWRGARRPLDFPAIYSGPVVWVQGGNPYDVDACSDVLARRGGKMQYWFLNPPTALPLLSGFALVTSFPVARVGWAVLSTGLVLLMIQQVWAFLGWHWREPRALGLAALTFALAPFHTSISQGQLTILIALLIVLSLRCFRADRLVLAGVLLALAGALKPQAVLLFAPYFLLRGKWRLCLSAVATLVVLAAIGIVPMQMRGIDWLGTYRAALAAANDAMNDPSQGGLGRYIVITLPSWLYGLIGQASMVVNGLTMAVAAGGIAVLVAKGRTLETQSPLLLYALLANLTMLVVYNRIYGGTVLILSAAWAIDLARRRKWSGRIGVALLLPLVISGTAMLVVVTDRGMIPHWLADSWFWRNVMLPHVPILLLTLLGIQIYHAVRLKVCLQSSISPEAC